MPVGINFSHNCGYPNLELRDIPVFPAEIPELRKTKNYALRRLYLVLNTFFHMSQRISKAAILEACLKKQQSLIDHFTQRIDEVKAEAYSHTETPSQTDEGSDSSEELLEVMGQELRFARLEMEILRAIDPGNPADKIERGAVVVTDQRIFFIGVSSEEIEIDGIKIFGMSEKAPLYAQMKGLKAGDTFQFNATRYQIKEIY
jgi:hypothetical protein